MGNDLSSELAPTADDRARDKNAALETALADLADLHYAAADAADEESMPRRDRSNRSGSGTGGDRPALSYDVSESERMFDARNLDVSDGSQGARRRSSDLMTRSSDNENYNYGNANRGGKGRDDSLPSGQVTAEASPVEPLNPFDGGGGGDSGDEEEGDAGPLTVGEFPGIGVGGGFE